MTAVAAPAKRRAELFIEGSPGPDRTTAARRSPGTSVTPTRPFARPAFSITLAAVPRPRPSGLFWLSFAGALAAGAMLRLYRLAPQILVGDEIHAVRAVAATPWPRILVTYHQTDVCLPLAGLARWLLERGEVLTETAFRAPVVAFGLLLLAVFPWLVRRVSAPAAALLFPWWLAFSPELVLYGRIARSYTPSTFLAGLAVAAFFAWWRTRRAIYAAGYAGFGALAVYFHLVTAPFVAAPLAFAGLAHAVRTVREGRRRREAAGGRRPPGRPGWAALALVGLALAAGLAGFLVPGWESLSEVISGKQGKSEIRADTLLGAGALLAGSAQPFLAAGFWLAAAGGLVVLFRRDPELALYSAFLVAVHLAALGVLQPFGMANPLVFGRYLLVALPVILLWVAHGFAWRSGRAGLAAGAALLVLILATGPFARPRFHHSSFLHHEDFLAFHRPLPTLPEEWIPRFYRRLARRPADRGAILELPAYPEGQNRALHRYQDLHRRDVLVATTDPGLNDPRFDFRTRVPPFPEAILASGARYLVVHRDLEAEELAVELPPGVPRGWRTRQRNLSEIFRHLAAGFPERAASVLGPPDEAYARLLVWDLDRARARRALSFRDGAPVPPLAEDLPAPAARAGALRRGGDPRPLPLRLADLPLAVAARDRAGPARDAAGGGGDRGADRAPGGPAG